MTTERELPEGVDEKGNLVFKTLPGEKKAEGLLRVSGVVLKDAIETWSGLWEELRDSVNQKGQITTGKKVSFTPSCGWAELLERMWLLGHYLDYMKRLIDGKA
ncbi:MAG: hypothetical protein E3J72_18615 [Planctomycetota bacterium]|nr:MAG: hypothetical protein E3J72_18615 [Planctomycetota bacterium]